MHEVFLVVLLGTTGAFLAGGVPVAFALAGAATLTAFAAYGFGVFDISFLAAISSRIFATTMTNTVLLAVPMFIFMGVVLEKSKVAEELLVTMGAVFGKVRGGLAYSVILVGMLMAASTGVVGATVVTMGLLSLPTMLRYGCHPALSSGVICASGTLGQIIPPSIVLILLGEQVSNGYVEARRRVGDFSPEPVSVGDLFVGALLPGLLLVGLYLLLIVVIAIFSKTLLPAVPHEPHSAKMARRVFTVILPPVGLIAAVLGAILLGLASPTESAAVGSIGAIFIAGYKIATLQRQGKLQDFIAQVAAQTTAHAVASKHALGKAAEFLFERGRRGSILVAVSAFLLLLVMTGVFDLRLGRDQATLTEKILIGIAMALVVILFYGIGVAVWRCIKTGVMRAAVTATMKMSTMVFTILIGATMFSLVFRAIQGDRIVHELLVSLPGGFWLQFALVMLVIFVLGFFLDFIEIIVIVIPIVTPTLLQFDINPIWYGIMIAVNLQTSFLTPPFGFALFYLRGVAPKSVATRDIYRGAIPFIALQLIALAFLIAVPETITWLPEVVFGSAF